MKEQPSKYKLAIAGLIGIAIAAKTIFSLKKYFKEKYYRRIASEKREKRDKELEFISELPLDIHPGLEKEIMNADATKLLELLNEGKVTSLQLVLFYIKRSSTIGKELELITEINFHQAIEIAKKCDYLRKSNSPKVKGLLFGLPISVKDNYNLKGKDSSFGNIRRLNNPEEEDGLFIKILKAEGAIPFVKTNVPQLLMLSESVNFIFGQAKNPWDLNRTPGGSSGGEAALVAVGCSPLGVGNDIGWSVRLPAMYCGIVGFKPSYGTICRHGFSGMDMEGQVLIKVVSGPMCKSVRDVNLFMKAMMNSEYLHSLGPYEGDVYQYKRLWKEEEVTNPRKLQIGYIKSFDFYPAAGCMQRVVGETCEILKKKGHTLVEFEIPNFERLITLYVQAIHVGGIENIFERNLNDEPYIPQYSKIKSIEHYGPTHLKLLEFWLKLKGEKRIAKFVPLIHKLPGDKILQLNNEFEEEQKKFMKFWEEAGLDALILPGSAAPAHLHNSGDKLSLILIYNIFVSMLNMVGGVVPVSVVQEDEQFYDSEVIRYYDLAERTQEEDMINTEGLPIGIQVVTPPFQEELCLNVMRQIEEQVKFNETHKFPQ